MKFFKNKKLTAEIIIILSLTVIWNQVVYNGSMLLTKLWDPVPYDMTTSVDMRIPYAPWTILIYFGCYIFWCVNYYICSMQEQKIRDRYFCADMLAKGMCMIFFLLLPTTNVRPDITVDSIWDYFMKFLYWVDPPSNLFPSIHCLASWLCWIGVRRRKDIPAAYRWFSLVAAIAICISTITTRQHVIYDAVSGILIAEISYLVAGNQKVCGAYSALIARIKRLFKV